MVDRHYHYRNTGQIGDPDSTPLEEVELTVAKTSGEGGEVMLTIRNEQFHGATISLTAAQIEHIIGVLEAYRDDEVVSDPTTLEQETVIHPDGSHSADYWEPM